MEEWDDVRDDGARLTGKVRYGPEVGELDRRMQGESMGDAGTARVVLPVQRASLVRNDAESSAGREGTQGGGQEERRTNGSRTARSGATDGGQRGNGDHDDDEGPPPLVNDTPPMCGGNPDFCARCKTLLPSTS